MGSPSTLALIAGACALLALFSAAAIVFASLGVWAARRTGEAPCPNGAVLLG
jgi:hypothetical protein